MNYYTASTIIALLSCIVSILLIPIIIRYSNKNGLHDYVNERKIHTGKISRLGGLAIFCGFVASFVYLVIMDFAVQFNVPLFACAFVLAFFTGFIDDVKPMKARYKLLLQLVSGLLVAISGLQVDKITLSSSITIHFGLFSYITTMLWVATCMNAINMLDGMDGLASGIIIIASVFIAILGYLQGMIVVTLLSIGLIGATAGFLLFNFPPAKIFMGDGGAYFLGFMYAVMPLIGIKKASTLTVFLIPLVLLLVPLIDMMHVVHNRFRGGYHIFLADKNHIHHKLLGIGFSRRSILGVLYSYTAILGCFAVIMFYLQPHFSLIILILLFVLTIITFYAVSVAHDQVCNDNNTNAIDEKT
ncbi:MAG: MraY family glycosyltransferase [Spirochaetota bacterium]